jgi:hypothetical protein
MKGWMKECLALAALVSAVVPATPAMAQVATIAAGDDGWVTQGGGLTHVDLAQYNIGSIFPGGSIVGDAVVNLKGKPLDSAHLGSIDTIVRHYGTTNFNAVGDTRAITVGVKALSMQSDNDTVTISGHGTYSLEVHLSTFTSASGTMTAHLSNLDGGTFDASFPVYPRLVFTNVSNPNDVVAVDCGATPGVCEPVTISTTNAGWTRTGGPGAFSPSAKGVTPIASGIAVDADGDGIADTTTIGNGSSNFYAGYAASAPSFPTAPGNHGQLTSAHATRPPQDCLPSPPRAAAKSMAIAKPYCLQQTDTHTVGD